MNESRIVFSIDNHPILPLIVDDESILDNPLAFYCPSKRTWIETKDRGQPWR